MTGDGVKGKKISGDVIAVLRLNYSQSKMYLDDMLTRASARGSLWPRKWKEAAQRARSLVVCDDGRLILSEHAGGEVNKRIIVAGLYREEEK